MGMGITAPREIAIVLGITSNAASIRLHRATKKLIIEFLSEMKGDQLDIQWNNRRGEEIQ